MHNGALKIAAHHHEGYTKVENSRLTGRNSEFALFPHASFPPSPITMTNEKKAVFARHELNELAPRSRVYHYFRHERPTTDDLTAFLSRKNHRSIR